MGYKQDIYQILDWDSKLFGYTVARLGNDVCRENLREVLQELKDKKVSLVYWFVDPFTADCNKAAKDNNGILVDEKVTYSIDTANVEEITDININVHSYSKKNVSEELMLLALQSGVHSRFSIDKHFVHNEYKKLYFTWINKSILRKIAFDVIVYTDCNNHINGFISLESKGANGSIGLLAVDKNFRGKSIGKILIKEACVRFNKLGYKKVMITTQKKNIIACQFYEKLGFSLVKTENVYHFWL